MSFSPYIIYVDESGDHSLESIDADYPIFVLAFCVFNKGEYATIAEPLLQEFKFKWFGHDMVVLHENNIVRRKYPFAFLRYDDIRRRFMEELGEIVANTPMTVIAAIIRKQALLARYSRPDNPYQLVLFCLERANEFLMQRRAAESLTHIVCEARSPRERGGMGKEDQALELERVGPKIQKEANLLARRPEIVDHLSDLRPAGAHLGLRLDDDLAIAYEVCAVRGRKTYALVVHE